MRQHGDPRRNYAREWKAWRRERGWTQPEMAQVLRLSERTIRNIERGRHPPALSSRERWNQLRARYREAKETYGN